MFEELGGGDDALEKSEENRTDGEEFVDEDVGGTASADFDTTITLDNKSTHKLMRLLTEMRNLGYPCHEMCARLLVGIGFLFLLSFTVR